LKNASGMLRVAQVAVWLKMAKFVPRGLRQRGWWAQYLTGQGYKASATGKHGLETRDRILGINDHREQANLPVPHLHAVYILCAIPQSIAAQQLAAFNYISFAF
jgi:hypothetical protein